MTGDTTQASRQSRRREMLNEIARLAGYDGWSAYETACLNGLAKPNTARTVTGGILPPEKNLSTPKRLPRSRASSKSATRR